MSYTLDKEPQVGDVDPDHLQPMGVLVSMKQLVQNILGVYPGTTIVAQSKSWPNTIKGEAYAGGRFNKTLMFAGIGLRALDSDIVYDTNWTYVEIYDAQKDPEAPFTLDDLYTVAGVVVEELGMERGSDRSMLAVANAVQRVHAPEPPFKVNDLVQDKDRTIGGKVNFRRYYQDRWQISFCVNTTPPEQFIWHDADYFEKAVPPELGGVWYATGSSIPYIYTGGQSFHYYGPSKRGGRGEFREEYFSRLVPGDTKPHLTPGAE